MACREIPIDFAVAHDAQTLALMARDLIENGLGWEYRRPRILSMIADPNTVALVARDHRRPVGFAMMSFGEERAHLVLLAVLPLYHRRGIGRRLVRWLIESAITAGTSSIHVELRTNNRAAYALYRGAGFVETVRVPGYYRGRETAVRMMRLLRAPNLAVPTWRPPTVDRR